MEDDFDIYEDLPSFETKEYEKCKEEIKELSQRCNNFQQENAELKIKITELLESIKTLSVNGSSLLKTAKAEIGRKDRMIGELRQQLDNMTFRRNGYVKTKMRKVQEKSERDNQQGSNVELEASAVENQAAFYQESDADIEGPEQKYEPEKIASTIFGERLRKKILIEQEQERIQKAEAKLALTENKVPSVKAIAEAIPDDGTASNFVKKEPWEISNDLPRELAQHGKSSSTSLNGYSLQSYEEDNRSLYDRREFGNNSLGKRINNDSVYPEHKRRKFEDERYHSDDVRYYNGNVKHEGRFNLESNDNCRTSRDYAKHVNQIRGSNDREELERSHQAHGKWNQSNNLSRSRTPDRRYVEKRSDRHRTDKYRAYMDKYQKRRNNGVNRNNDYSNVNSKDGYGFRCKVEYRDETKIGGRSEYNSYKNGKLDWNCERGAHESPSSEKCRRSRKETKVADKRRAKRSESSDRLAIANTSAESSKEREGVITRSKDPKSNVADRKGRGVPKLEKRSKTNSEKKVTDIQPASSALLSNGSEKKVTNKQTASTTLSSDGLPLESKSEEIPVEIKKLRKNAKTKPKDPEPTDAEEKDRDTEQKSQMTLRKSSDKEATCKELASCALVIKASKLESDEIHDVQKDLNGESSESATVTLRSVLKEVDDPGKWISSVLENDAEVPSVPPEILASDNIDSRSFREEKIENIEKFIQNYQYDENLRYRNDEGDTEKLERENKMCNSTSSILDTLSMDMEDDAIGKPEDGGLDDSLIREQLVLKSLSTPVKKNSSPSLTSQYNVKQPHLPPIPHSDELKQPPLPPISPTEETKQQSLPPLPSSDVKQQPSPPLPPPDEIKQPPLPPLPPPEEIKQQPLPPLPSSDERQQPSPPLPPSGEKQEALSPVPSPHQTKQTLQPHPSSDDKRQFLPPFSHPEDTKQLSLLLLPSLDENQQPLALLSPSDEKKQALPPLPSPDEKRQTLQPHPSSDNKKLSLPALLSPERTQQPSSPSSDTENHVLPPLSSPDNKAQRLSASLSDSAKKLQPPSPPALEEKNNLPLLQPPASEENTKSLQQSALEEKKDLPLPSMPAPKDEPTPLLSASSKKTNLPLSLLPASNEKKDPPSPLPSTPTEKITEISVKKEISTSNSEPEKTQTEKIALRQINKRPRIPSNPILSKYFRKKRDLVLTDFTTSQCIIKSNYSSNPETNNNGTKEIKVPHIFNEELKIISQSIDSSELDDTASKNSNNNSDSMVERSERLYEAVNVSVNASRIESEESNTIFELSEPEKVDSLPQIVFTMVSDDEISNSEKDPENNAHKPQPELESEEEATLEKIQNPESSSTVEKLIYQKPVETRGTRAALKTMVQPGPSGNGLGASFTRKRHLTKEKENQVKQVAKQCKIMIIARKRRTVQFEDSSTVTTLVTSVQDANCDRSSKNNSLKNNPTNDETPEHTEPIAEPSSKGRKRRSADK